MTSSLPQESQRLKGIARDLRRRCLETMARAQSGHPGDSLSAVEILTALYFHELRSNAQDPKWSDRDRVVVGMSRIAPALYATLQKAGFLDGFDLTKLRQLESPLEGHPMRNLPGVEASVGRPGHALAIANGMALAARMDSKAYRCFALLGTEDLLEGSCWEAALTAAHHRLASICVVVNAHGFLADGATCEVQVIEPMEQKWRSFGWDCVLVNGHHIDDLIRAFSLSRRYEGRPTCIVARTVKGRGVSFMENSPMWHAKAIGPDELELALNALDLIHC